jgi:polyferredoxin
MLFDTTDEPDSEEDLAEALENAKSRFRLWRRRSLYATAAFILSCAAVYPFVDGRTLSAQGESLKQVFLLLSLGLLIVFLYCTLLLWGAWRSVRDLELGRT